MTMYLEVFWGIFLEISPFVILGMLAAGFVHEALGRFQRLRRFALKRNPWSLSFFNFAGFTLPICSCGVVPLAVGLRKQGVPFGNLFTFIFSAPATSIAAVILSLAVLGPDFTGFYVVGALACGYAVGIVFYLAEPNSASNRVQGSFFLCDSDSNGGNVASQGFFRRAVYWGTVTYGSRIAFDLIAGLALAALLISTYSVQALAGWVGELPYWQAAVLMIGLAVPLYVCSLPGIIVAATLILGGFTPALVWIFLMAGPVTNLGDINVLRRNLGWGATLAYVSVVVTVTFLWGWVIHTNLQWTDIWIHVREYYAAQPGLAEFDGEITGALVDLNWLQIPREVYYASAFMMIFFTINGARLALQEFWVNPCLHCKHFQQDMRLNPAICRQPCWKSRLLRIVKRNTVSEPRWVSRRKSVNLSHPRGLE